MDYLNTYHLIFDIISFNFNKKHDNSTLKNNANRPYISAKNMNEIPVHFLNNLVLLLSKTA